MWGQEFLMLILLTTMGIIPMRVGTSTKVYHEIMCAGDHPHACGDKKLSLEVYTAFVGSSPCVWGQVTTLQPFTPAIRIIPMRVGTRSVAFADDAKTKDHPHACGDKHPLLLSS